jgi:hypothetical protein
MQPETPASSLNDWPLVKSARCGGHEAVEKRSEVLWGARYGSLRLKGLRRIELDWR